MEGFCRWVRDQIAQETELAEEVRSDSEVEEDSVGTDEGDEDCRSTKTQVNPSSALNRTKLHQRNPSNVPEILDSNLSKRACIYS